MMCSLERVEKLILGEIIDIQGITPGKDLYNITAPFDVNGDTFILGREESEAHARDSKVIWVKKENGIWRVDRKMPSIVGEDPSITEINGEIIIGVVKVKWKRKKPENWTTNFYRGRNLKQLKKAIKKDSFTFGPRKMKDIRLVGLDSGKIGVFTRPDETKKIGYIELDSLDELNEENILRAETIDGMFADDEWGGVNEVHKLDDGRLGILGHIANGTENPEELHYRAVTFIFDPKTRKFSNWKEIATSADFPSGRAKEDKLYDVIFSGGLKIHENGKATLYVGLRDKEAASIEIENPFI